MKRKEIRFLYFVLLKFSLISVRARNYLISKIRLQFLLNLILFEKCRQNRYINSNEIINFEIINIDRGLFETTHDILNWNSNQKIMNVPDISGRFIISNYDYILLCNLLFYKERTKEDFEKKDIDIGFTFYNKKYIEQLIIFATTKQDINYLSNLFSKKCINSNNIFDKILDRLIFFLENIQDSEYSFYDIFEEEKNDEIYRNDNTNNNVLKRLRSNIHIIFKKIIFQGNDDNFEYRIKNSINQLYSLFKKYSKYYGISILIINIIIDILSESVNENLSEKFQKILNEIKDWLIKNKIAPKIYDIKGIKMYKPDDNMINIYERPRHVKEEIREFFDKEEIRKTRKKIEIIDKILNGENIEKDISNYNCDLTDFKFTIGDEVIYENKDYIITDCIDELIKIKLIDNDKEKNKEKGFKAKGFHEKKMNIFDKEKINMWIETDKYNLRIKKLFENKKKL